MSKKDNKKCIICGKTYSYCPSCNHDVNKPSWYMIFDSENCKNIYDICVDYRDGVIDKQVAYEKLKDCDLSGLKDFASSTKKQIEEILNCKSTTTVDKTIKENKKDEKTNEDNKKSAKVFSKK